MKRLFAAVALAAALFAVPAFADTSVVNSSAYPLSGGVLFPARGQRVALRCYNPTTNHAVTITYPSGFAIVLNPGGSLFDTQRVPSGAITSTGTATEVLPCEDTF